MNNAYVESPLTQSSMSNTSLMVACVMLKDGYEPGMGLGWNGDCMVSLLEIAENHRRFGLDYKPTSADKKRIDLERKEKFLARLQGREPRVERVPIYHIIESFVSTGCMYEDQVAMLDEKTD